MYENFAKLLTEHGITPYRVHKATGVAQSTLSDWKNGKCTPGVDKLKKIADFFGVTVDYFISEENSDQTEKAPEKSETLLYAACTGSQASPEAMARNVARVRALLTPMAQRVGERYDRADAGTQSAVRKLLDIND